MLSFKKIILDWHLVGFLPLIFGILCYFFYFTNQPDFWRFLWLCPLVAVAGGFAVLLRSRFGMSAAIAWISMGPLLAVMFELKRSFQFWNLHHIFSVAVLFIILYQLKNIWDEKGFLFGVTSFYAYVIITSGLSKGEVNLLASWIKIDNLVFSLGILLFIISIQIIFLRYSNKKNNKINNKNLCNQKVLQ